MKDTLSQPDFLLRCLKRRDHTVRPGVELGILDLQFRMAHQIRNGPADALLEMNLRAELRHRALQLRVIENNGLGFVADQAARKIIFRSRR